MKHAKQKTITNKFKVGGESSKFLEIEAIDAIDAMVTSVLSEAACKDLVKAHDLLSIAAWIVAPDLFILRQAKPPETPFEVKAMIAVHERLLQALDGSDPSKLDWAKRFLKLRWAVIKSFDELEV